jgi:hypothetical protein
MAYIIKTKRGWVGRMVLEDEGAGHRLFGVIPTGFPFSYWTRTLAKEEAYRFETPEEAARVSVLLNAGNVVDENFPLQPVIFRPFIANMRD